MCGIAGVLGLGRDLSPEKRGIVAAMLAAMAHRGPDGQGVSSRPRALLGNVRLKITDLRDEAALPMVSGGVHLAYNGAVTNFRQLRRSLRLDDDHRFRTGSDAEVMLALYRRLGIDFVRRLSGMFAFGLYDEERGKAYLVRDFYGQRPLFFSVQAGDLYFASEIKAFLEVPGFPKKLDEEAIHHFMTLAYIPGDRTPFAALRELGGGEWLEVDLVSGRWCRHRYHAQRFDQDRSITEESAAARLRELLVDSLQRAMDVDVPVGLTLSGGVDTGGLLGLLRQLGMARRTHTFSIRIAEPSFDESRYQRLLVDWARPVHHEIVVRPRDVLANLKAHMAFLDEPSGDGAAVPLFILAREASRHVRVLLSGEGGDEVFNAYETHRAWKARRLYRSLAPSTIRGLVRRLIGILPCSYEKLSFDFVAKRFAEGSERDAVGAHVLFRQALGEEEKAGLLRLTGLPPTDELFRKQFNSLPFDDEINKLSSLDLQYYFIDDLMVKNDRMLAAHSLEARYPYMDRFVVEFASSIPAALKLKGFRGRHIQKLAFRGLLPPGIERRSNMGLEMPHSIWFFQDFQPLARYYFSADHLERCGLLRPQAVARLWREHVERKRDNGRALWCIINFLIWFDLFVYDGDYKRHMAGACAPVGFAS